MAKTNAFKLAELIRVFQYDSSNDVITTSKRTEREVMQLKLLLINLHLTLLRKTTLERQDTLLL